MRAWTWPSPPRCALSLGPGAENTQVRSLYGSCCRKHPLDAAWTLPSPRRCGYKELI